jgi:hypothetical protein
MPSRQESTYCREGESIEMTQKHISTKSQDSATATETQHTYDQKNVEVRYELQLRPYQLAWLKEELEYFNERIKFCLYGDSEDAVKWRIDPYYSGAAEDRFKSIKSVTETEYILEEIDRSFSVQNYWKAIRLNASQLEWLQYFFLYGRDALMRGTDPRPKSEKQPETEWKCDCAIIDHLLKNIESLNAISMISYSWGQRN